MLLIKQQSATGAQLPVFVAAALLTLCGVARCFQHRTGFDKMENCTFHTVHLGLDVNNLI
jgi:hypothetical protein